MDLITEVLKYLNDKFKNIQVVQVGAMDGFSFDDVRGHLEKYKWDEILVEPVPHVYEKLVNNLKHRDNCVFENSAITTEDGKVKMITVSEDIIKENNLHPGYEGMSALYPLKNGFGTDYERDIFVKDNLAQTIDVNGITLDSLITKHNVKNIDVFLTDAEGHDWMIFNQLDLNKFRPKFIRMEYVNLTKDEQKLVKDKLIKNDYYFEEGFDIIAIDNSLYNEFILNINKESNEKNMVNNEKKNLTIVTGLWNINRNGRSFDHYIEHFKNFLKIPQNLFIYVPQELESMVWEHRSKENTYVKVMELEDVKHLYAPFWDRTQKIRTDLNWSNQAGWLPNSPQASLEWYNPIVQGKMFMLNDASIWNPFDTEYFFWLDAGITNTVPVGHLVDDNVLEKLPKYGNPFLFLSYDYQADKEIHGFDFKSINRISGEEVKYVCRGGLFGGHKQQLNEANSTYYALLDQTLAQGLMGTEESLFTIMSYLEPDLYKRFELDSNGLVVKFTQALKENNVKITEPNVRRINNNRKYTDRDVNGVKTNLYMLTFNFPEQVLHTINSMKKTPEWLERPNLFLLDNSTKPDAKVRNREIAKEYNFEYIDLGGNTGICGGRQAAAEHFHDSDADFMFFFEDDMTVNPPDVKGVCRNGFRKYIPNIYNLVHRIMLKEQFDFLKLSFTEVYFDNDKQCSWYNVPQEIRTRDWPHYDKLPVSGLDPNVPLTNFKNIRNMDGLTYIDGEIYYANWPMIVSKEGNKKMFIDTKWGHPYEQTWMSYMYQKTKKGELNPAILLASPIWHERIKHYRPEERREN
jgi:FkbM family methyltransferase